MLNSLKSPIWQFVGVVVTVLIALASYYHFVLNRPVKELTYQIVSNTPLVKVEDEVEGKLAILYDNQPVKGVQLVLIKVENSGNVPVLSADYERPISFDFPSPASILSVEVAETKPANLDVGLRVEGNKVTIEPLLLNPADSFQFKILLSEQAEINQPGGRIIGVSQLRLVRGDETAGNVVEITMPVWLFYFVIGAGAVVLVMIVFIRVFLRVYVVPAIDEMMNEMPMKKSKRKQKPDESDN